MKIGLLSDIHANAAALESVLLDAEAVGVERLLCCGDYVGYYYAPQAVIDLLDKWHWSGVRGNHEAMLEAWLDGRDRDSILRKYGSGIAAAAQMSERAIGRVLSLPTRQELTIDGRRVLLCHGSTWDSDHYIYPDAQEGEKSRLASEGQDMVVFGHSHYPVIWTMKRTTIVNPGSVGQPRDRKPGASWALWDTCNMEVLLRRTIYDSSPLVALAKTINPELPYLADVLSRSAP